MATPTLYESQANQLAVASLTNWTNTVGDLQSYVANSQATVSNDQYKAALNAQGNATATAQEELQGEVNATATLQESANANQYIAQMLDTQQSAIQTQTNTVRQQQFKLRDELMHAHYLQRYYQTATQILILTMIVVLILMIPAALWRIGRMSITLFSAIVLVVVIGYLCLMVYVTSRTARRVRDSWDRMEWPINSEMRKSIEIKVDPSCS